ncbi:MAG: calcium/sodium antiporter [Prevotella sp.]|nr:calcium/sodium antiporter [Prevotella sp.]
MSYIFILLGILLLVKGGDYLIEGSVVIARRAKLSPMIIGLTVIGFGTSMPELCVSAQAAWTGSSGIALGNVAGSNISNIALILGVTALIHPIPAKPDILRRGMPVFVLALCIIIAVAINGTIERWMGMTMVGLLIIYLIVEIRRSRKIEAAKRKTVSTKVSKDASSPAEEISIESTKDASSSADVNETDSVKDMPLWKALSVVILSLAAMVWGSDMLVSGASDIAHTIGDSMGVDPVAMERIIGLTIVAVGTSLPELCASVIAARKGETDMAVGNIIGSGIFNILCVVGVASSISPIHNSWHPFALDYIVQLGLCLLLWLFLRTNHLLQRWEGAIFTTIYVSYILFVLYSAS